MPSKPFLKSVLRLFLSVDIVGSTALKQASAAGNKPFTQDGETWQEIIAGFFSNFDSQLRSEWDSSKTNLGADFKHLNDVEPTFWKGSGDEALYYVNLSSKDEALFSVASFNKAVFSIRKKLKQKDSRLDLKATAWLAGFPVNNFEFVVGGNAVRKNPENPIWDDIWVSTFHNRLEYDTGNCPHNMSLDFVGPQIDLGFRLTAQATPRRMVVSVDLAWLLIEAYMSKKEKWTGRFDITKSFYVEERINLKGVLSGTPYPLIWIDALPDEDFHKAEFLALRKMPADVDSVKKYCEKFITTMSEKHRWMILPFIRNIDGEIWGEEKKYQKDALEGWKQRWRDAEKSLSEPDPEPDDGDENGATSDNEVTIKDFISTIEKLLAHE